MLAAGLALALAACGQVPVRPQVRNDGGFPHIARGPVAAPADAQPATAVDPCAPTRVHRDSDYTAGGLYAPGVADGGPAGPIDVSRLQEPVPRREPRARTGNRSPYTVLGKVYRVLDDSRGYHERGLASWYGTKFNGRATSSGELYDICSFTAAHKTLPLPSYVRVTNLDNGRSLVVRVNDRGPFHEGRVMDLSYAAAVRLGVDRAGTAHVDLQAIDPEDAGGTYALAPVPVRGPARSLAAQDANASNPAGPGELYRALPPPSRRRPVEASEPATQPGEPATASSNTAMEPGNPTTTASNPATAAGEPTAEAMVTILAGSFADEGNARRLADRLGDASVGEVALEPVEVQGRAMWRVRVGPVAADSADALLRRLQGLDVAGARVLRR